MEGPVDTSDHDGRAGPGGSDHGDDPLDSAAAVADEKPGQSPESTADPEKTAAIVEACRWRDLSRLRDLAQSGGGLLSDDLRREACAFDYIDRGRMRGRADFLQQQGLFC